MSFVCISIFEVETTQGLRKLAFDGKVDEAAAREFVGVLREALKLKSL